MKNKIYKIKYKLCAIFKHSFNYYSEYDKKSYFRVCKKCGTMQTYKRIGFDDYAWMNQAFYTKAAAEQNVPGYGEWPQ